MLGANLAGFELIYILLYGILFFHNERKVLNLWRDRVRMVLVIIIGLIVIDRRMTVESGTMVLFVLHFTTTEW